MKFREIYGATVIGIRRGDRRVITPSGKDVLVGGDLLLVAGRSEVMKKLRDQASL